MLNFLYNQEFFWAFAGAAIAAALCLAAWGARSYWRHQKLKRLARVIGGLGDNPSEDTLHKAYRELEQRVRRHTEELSASRSKYQELVTTIDGIVWEANIGNPGYAFVSPQAEKLTGYPADRWMLEPRFWQKLLHPEDLQKITGDRYVYPEQKRDMQVEYRIITADGRVLWVCDHIKVIEEDGKARKMRGVMVDISERKRTEAELSLAQQKSIEAAKVKSEFLANMSHEIRTPLNAIVGMSSLGLEYEMSPELRDCLDTVKTAADSLLTLVNDILDFSKIEAGRIDLEISDFRLSSLCRNALDVISPLAQKKELEVSLEIDPALPEYVRGDAGRLLQVLMNMLGNAVKFTGPRGKVGLRVSRTHAKGAPSLRLTVSDTGVGIAPDVIERLFQPFTQADSTTARKYGGTGLGLSICKRLLLLMGGEVGVDSRLGEGSSFWCELPLAEGSAANCAAATEEEIDPAMPEREARVLVVDDNPANLKLMQRFLARLGYKPELVANGKEAITAFCSGGLDLILMDCQMPELDGYEATRAIRELESNTGGRRIPVIALTAHAMSGDKEKCLTAGMDDYLTKPISIQDLRKALRKWLAADMCAAKTAAKAVVPIPALVPAPDEAAPVEADPSLPRVDYEYLDGLAEFNEAGKPDLASELIQIFFEQSPLRIAAIEAAAKKGALDPLRKEAHSLKSTCHNVGARGLAALCEAMEAAAQPESPAADPLFLVKRYLRDYEAVNAELERYRRARRAA